MSRRRIVCIRFAEHELEQLRAAVVLQRRAGAAPVAGDARALGPFIRAAALAAAAAAVPGRSEGSRITPAPSRARDAP